MLTELNFPAAGRNYWAGCLHCQWCDIFLNVKFVFGSALIPGLQVSTFSCTLHTGVYNATKQIFMHAIESDSVEILNPIV